MTYNLLNMWAVNATSFISVVTFCWRTTRRFYVVLRRVHTRYKSVWKGPERAVCLMDGHFGKEMDWVESGMIRSGGLTSLVFHRCLSFGSEVHFGRHSSSFLGRYIFKCPCSSTTRARQNRYLSQPSYFIDLHVWLFISLSDSLQQNADCKITIPNRIRELI